MYTYAGKMIQLYNCLQDELSKKIFWARLQFEAEPDMDRAVQLCEIGHGKREQETAWRNQFAAAAAGGKRIVLYGAGFRGALVAERLLRGNADFYAFCDQKKAGEIILGKPVLSPQELISTPEQYAVIITTSIYNNEIFQFLHEHGFPSNSVLHCPGFEGEITSPSQYREFPELFRTGTAIVDAGCFDGEDTIQFAKWCSGAYSKIYAFEPDAKNVCNCKANIETAGVPNVSLFQAGLSATQGKSAFAGALNGCGHLIETSAVKYNIPQLVSESDPIQVYALDDLADTEIGLIKMDIEGAEFDALHGAKRTIQRDKPQMAICVYHRQGDMLAIMEYLHSIVPEYRFWLRHYGPLDGDTVLYAAI